MQKRKLGPCVTFFPQPATLVASSDGRGKVNLMMASWVGIVSKTPPTLAVSLHADRQTYANIKMTKTFSVNVVSERFIVEADFCGLASGKEYDKLGITGLTIESGTESDCPLIVESSLNVECRQVNEVELGAYRLVLGEILQIHACEDAFNVTGQATARVFDPVVYLGGLREYYRIGEKVADAYMAGAVLLSKKSDK